MSKQSLHYSKPEQAYHVLQGGELRVEELSEMLVVLANLEVIMPLHLQACSMRIIKSDVSQIGGFAKVAGVDAC